MRKIIVLFCLFQTLAGISQTKYEELLTKTVGIRQIKIQLPRNYETNVDKKYPVIITLDGDYLFEPVAGNVDYYSYWNDMPEALVIGIMQEDRESDTFYDDMNYVPVKQSLAFFEFIGLELFPWLEKNYRIADFRMLIGHDITANFVNYYLLKDEPLFQAYVSLGPDLAPLMDDRLVSVLTKLDNDIFYYMCTSTDDVPSMREKTVHLQKSLAAIENPHFSFGFNDFTEGDHYSLVALGIPSAFNKIFSMYRPIDAKEYKRLIQDVESEPFNYLMEKYRVIDEFFGIDEKMHKNDIIAVGNALIRIENWEELEKLGKMAFKQYPDSMVGPYFLGYSQESMGDIKGALRTYRGSFILKEFDFITKDLLIERVKTMRSDFGY